MNGLVKTNRLHWCWWQRHVGVRFKMSVTESLYWRLFLWVSVLSDAFKTKPFIEWTVFSRELNRSSIFQSCHQHIPSQTYVINIDIAGRYYQWHLSLESSDTNSVKFQNSSALILSPCGRFRLLSSRYWLFNSRRKIHCQWSSNGPLVDCSYES